MLPDETMDIHAECIFTMQSLTHISINRLVKALPKDHSVYQYNQTVDTLHNLGITVDKRLDARGVPYDNPALVDFNAR